MNLEQYRAWRRTAMVPAEMLDIMDLAYTRRYGRGAVTKAMGIKTKPFSGPVHTYTLGDAVPRATQQARLRKQLEVGVRRAFAKAGLCCWECGGRVDEAAQARVCSGCSEEE